MKELKAITLMQLRNKLDMSSTKSGKDRISKPVFFMLKIVLATAFIYLLMKVAISLNIFSLSNYLPVNVLVCIFTIMEVLAIIGNSIKLSEDLYFSNDNKLLISFPIKSSLVFISKLIVYYIYEVVRNCYYFLPLFLAYGIVSGSPLYYYPWMVFCLLLLTAITVLISAIISILTMIIRIAFKKSRIFSFVTFTLLIGIIVYCVVALIRLIPNDLNIISQWSIWFWEIQEFLTKFAYYSYPFEKFVSMVVGSNYYLTVQMFTIQTFYTLFAVIGLIVLLFFSSYLISRPVFFNIATKQFEHINTSLGMEKKNKKKSHWLSIFGTEVKLTLRNNKALLNIITVAIVLPISILLFNKIIAAMDTKVLGKYLAVFFNILFILLISLSSSSSMASKYSGEGNAGIIAKSYPIKSNIYMFSKLFFNLVIMTISIVISVCIIQVSCGITITNTILLATALWIIYFAHLLKSSEIDLMAYKNVSSSFETATAGKNENKSTIIAFILSFIFSGLILFFMYEKYDSAFWKLLFLGIFLMSYCVWSYFTKIRYYFFDGDKNQ